MDLVLASWLMLAGSCALSLVLAHRERRSLLRWPWTIAIAPTIFVAGIALLIVAR